MYKQNVYRNTSSSAKKQPWSAEKKLQVALPVKIFMIIWTPLQAPKTTLAYREKLQVALSVKIFMITWTPLQMPKTTMAYREELRTILPTMAHMYEENVWIITLSGKWYLWFTLLMTPSHSNSLFSTNEVHWAHYWVQVISFMSNSLPNTKPKPKPKQPHPPTPYNSIYVSTMNIYPAHVLMNDACSTTHLLLV